MIFSGSVDARAIAECRGLGNLGSNVVASIINALFQSFIFVEVRETHWSFGRIIEELEMFPDWKMKERMKASLKKMRTDDRVKTLRFSQMDMAEEDVHSRVIDFLLDRVNQVLCRKSEERNRDGFCRLQEYLASRFENRRSSFAVNGIYRNAGDCTAKSFLEEMLAEISRWTDRICIIDYSIGENWCNRDGKLSANYPPALTEWCDYLLSLDRELHVTLHTSGGYCGKVQEKVKLLTGESLVDFSVVKHERAIVPHRRFVYALGFLVDIDPGIDLFKDGFVKDIAARIVEDKKARALLSRKQ